MAYSVHGFRASAFLLLGLGLAGAQVFPPGGGGYPGGGYPGGGYPGGGGGYPGGGRGYPGGGGSGIPMPGSKKQPKTTTSEGQPLPNFRGTLKRLDDKSIAIELGDNRVLDFKRTGKTRFFKNGDEVKNPKFNLGDQVSVEGPEDNTGTMVAVNVYWEKAGGGSSTDTARSPEKDKADGVPDTWADKPAAAKANDDPDRPVLRRAPSAADSKPSSDAPAAAKEAPEPARPSAPEATAERTPPPARSDDDDPGRPVLRRGGPTGERKQIPAAPADAPVASARNDRRPPGPPSEDEHVPIVRRGSGDDLIRKATDAALDFTEGLPAYVCQEMVTRYQGEGRPTKWSPIDIVTMNLVYENMKEDYRDIQVNGKPKKSLEESGGAWSTGEFGTVLIDLFSPATATDFVFQRDSRVNGISAKLYDFSVDKPHSHWSVHMGSQSYDPPYKGSVWIDPQTGRVMRIEMQAYGFPGSFPIDHTESATDYQYIRLGDAKQYLLPVHAETLSCQRGSDYCSRNVIDFRNYHKYSGESNITFEGPKK
jgi:hypothetical protein